MTRTIRAVNSFEPMAEALRAITGKSPSEHTEKLCKRYGISTGGKGLVLIYAELAEAALKLAEEGAKMNEFIHVLQESDSGKGVF
jgi:hypothetical protein